jgi:hypothetical protein
MDDARGICKALIPLAARRNKQDVRVTKDPDLSRTNPSTPWEITHIIRCTSQPIKAARITLVRSLDIVAGKIDLVIFFQSICLCPHYTQRHSVIETMRYSHSLLRLMVKPIVWFVLMARIYQSLILVKLTAD